VKLKHVIFAILIALATCVAAFFGFLLWLSYYCDWFPYTELSKIDVGNGRTVSIYSKSCWEVSRAVYYDAHEAGKVIVPQTLWEHDSGFEEYTLAFISAENGSLVGIFDPNKPLDEFFIMIDFKNGESWPQFESASGRVWERGGRPLQETPERES
jgi:hypothetical protein